ncbi:hypothetical protein HD_0720 [[Haemophilus] ducreyi 35000HP]|uniref:Uncharacterized protein n=1 Tax=Haemophilus ducreyi (strain 35000HP / ATCC 700724) TaxID=233412 RepID=Q7VN60_HAEDU|nr:hypothetical protein HD_0720 [[Haemophilus] ducreyi 35000HP]
MARRQVSNNLLDLFCKILRKNDRFFAMVTSYFR